MSRQGGIRLAAWREGERLRKQQEMQLKLYPELVAAMREIAETAAACELGNARRPLSQVARARLANQIDEARAVLAKAGVREKESER